MNKLLHNRQLPLAKKYEDQILHEQVRGNEEIIAAQCHAKTTDHTASSKARVARARSSASYQTIDAAVLVCVSTSMKDNPGPGSYGLTVTTSDGIMETSEFFPDVTGPLLDLESVIAALEALQPIPGTAAILATARYTVESINNGQVSRWEEADWMRSNGTPVANSESWAELLRLYRGRDVAVAWVGHGATPEMKRCDALAMRTFRARKSVKAGHDRRRSYARTKRKA
jgi:ribonuclease HI